MSRSGTTFLRSVLSVHPRIAMSRETHFMAYWWEKYRHVDLSQRANFDAFWQDFRAGRRFDRLVPNPDAVKSQILAAEQIDLKTVFTTMMDGLARELGKPRWGEKTPQHYRYLRILLDWYPRGQVIWLLRDPRAVVNSGREAWPSQRVDDRARQWARSVQTYEKHWQGDERIKLVQYENLVTDNESQVRDICNFLGETFHPEMITDRRKIAGVLDVPGNTRDRLTNQQATIERLERWRQTLSLDEVAQVEHYAASAMNNFHYPRTTRGLNFWRAGQLALERMWRRQRGYLYRCYRRLTSQRMNGNRDTTHVEGGPTTSGSRRRDE